MRAGPPYSLIDEMLEVPGLMRRFDAGGTLAWRDKIRQKPLFFTGEGSSRIFPSKNAMHVARQLDMSRAMVTEGARQAAEYDLSGYAVIAASNSGRTRELVNLFEKLHAQKTDAYVVTATPGSRVTELATASCVLTCGPEKATAASKSVIEQALVLQSLVDTVSWKNMLKAAEAAEKILQAEVSADIRSALERSSMICFAGRNDGVAEELVLKANEIARCKSDYLEGTYALHGIEEVLTGDELVVLIEPFAADMQKYQDVLSKGAGVSVVAISSVDTPFPTLRIPAVPGFDGYLQLMAGWNLLVTLGLARNINLDKTARARKVGNEIFPS